MRLAVRLLRPAPNQNVTNPKMWQDPVRGYFECHGRSEFLPGETYNLTDDEKKAVLWRHRVKEILKKEYLRRDFDPHTYKYKQGVVIDPAMFRWYAADMTQAEYFRYTPRTVFLSFGAAVVGMYFYLRIGKTPDEWRKDKCLDGKTLWWDRQEFRGMNTAGHGPLAPNWPQGW